MQFPTLGRGVQFKWPKCGGSFAKLLSEHKNRDYTSSKTSVEIAVSHTFSVACFCSLVKQAFHFPSGSCNQRPLSAGKPSEALTHRVQPRGFPQQHCSAAHEVRVRKKKKHSATEEIELRLHTDKNSSLSQNITIFGDQKN